ncbi:tetratricopeptide repeat protein [Sphingomonas jatrophae]|uniref:Ancillary SecYEG translocon subunit/Cell division coordinator CpoB TPR domain-containing protein n=1 Tax=Sphingomonas jatrophae TaxID=1166337 RepID=A0A1I6LLV9_9SPHN|nr:tetratricopeptide repeat protein [Sphingomonas jatrophae]SFS04379.1 hypothetical protein SAMN05192580_2927 [Sphingomonas jatrophae]
MALTPANQDAFFREVDEELRAAQLKRAWRRYGVLIGALVVLALMALAGALYWQHRRAAALDARAEAFDGAIAALGDGREAPARAALGTLAADGSDTYAVAARLTQAGLAQSKGDLKAAAAQFRTIAADTNVPQPFRDLATIRGTAAEFDTLAPAQVIERLKPLAVAGGPWFGSAGEMTALAYLKMNQPAKAGPLFAALAKDKTLPETLRARAVRISGQLGVDGVAAAGEAG